MESEKCKIELESPQSIYYSGQEVKGKITLILAKRTKLRGIQLKVNGYGKCSWYEILRRESPTGVAQKPNQRSIIYTSNQNYLEHEAYIIGSKSGRAFELDIGSHSYSFNFQLPYDLPSSFTGSHGSIKYKLKFIIDKAWNFDDKYSVSITVVKAVPLYTLEPPTTPILRQNTKNIGLFGGGPISLFAEVPNYKVIRGEKLLLRVTVDNKSNTHVERLKFSIRQVVKYHSQHPMRIKKEEIMKLYKKDTGGVLKKSERTFEHELQVPCCQPEDQNPHNIIEISYFVQVDVILPALYKNLTLCLPFKIHSHEIIGAPPNCSSDGSVISNTSSNFNMQQHPMQSPLSSLHQFPRIDFIGINTASPSHSYCSERSLPSGNCIVGFENGLSNFSPSFSLSSLPGQQVSARSRTDFISINEALIATAIINSSGSISNRSSISGQEISADIMNRSYPNSYPSYPTATPGTSSRLSGRQFPEELPPSYTELFGNQDPTVPTKFPSAPPLND